MDSEKVPSAKVARVVNDARHHDPTLLGAWEEHIGSEFAAKSPDLAIATMTDDPYVNTVALMIGGRGRDEVRAFYADHFLSQIPLDTEMVPVSRTVGQGRVVDEFVVRFTHTVRMDWILPGVSPTGRRWSSRPSWSCSSTGTRSRTSTSTGTRPRCSCRSASSIARSRSSAARPRRRCLTPRGR
jgi:hypothetical protein